MGIFNDKGTSVMLKHIPFYASLLGRGLSNGKNANNGMVLVYGAIEVHSMGDKGCIASNKLIGDETGLSAGTVANYISELNKSGWVKVITDTSSGGTVRVKIEPLLTIATPSHRDDTLHTQMIPPSSGDDTPLHTSVNIGNSKGNIEETSVTKVTGEPSDVGIQMFGKSEINELFDNWEEVVGYKITGNMTKNRYAANNLFKKHGLDGVQKLIRGVHISQTDKYAPRISDFVSLQAKYNDLLAWGKRTGNQSAKIASF